MKRIWIDAPDTEVSDTADRYDYTAARRAHRQAQVARQRLPDHEPLYTPPDPAVDPTDALDEAAAGRIAATRKADRGDLMTPTGSSKRIKPLDLSDREAVARECDRSWSNSSTRYRR